jgi:hypothetical protein
MKLISINKFLGINQKEHPFDLNAGYAIHTDNCYINNANNIVIAEGLSTKLNSYTSSGTDNYQARTFSFNGNVLYYTGLLGHKSTKDNFVQFNTSITGIVVISSTTYKGITYVGTEDGLYIVSADFSLRMVHKDFIIYGSMVRATSGIINPELNIKGEALIFATPAGIHCADHYGNITTLNNNVKFNFLRAKAKIENNLYLIAEST